MDQSFFVVDAFTAEPFRGNPASVVPLSHWPSDSWLQNVAMEMNHAETAFFVPEGSGYRLRWFTPAVEVNLCGHATLATALVMRDRLGLWKGKVSFETRSGTLVVSEDGERLALDEPHRGERWWRTVDERVTSVAAKSRRWTLCASQATK